MYVATPPGLGMYVNIYDPDDETVLSRVRIDIGVIGGEVFDVLVQCTL